MSLIVENFSTQNEITVAQSAVIRTLIYFDIFSHPLTAPEIFQLIQDPKFPETEIFSAIEGLKSAGIISGHDGYFYLPNKEESVARRQRGEKQAEKSLEKARKYSARIASFPFVRAIALSGSISKKYMDNDSDIDYFIITSPGRMWVARTLLVLYKKIFLLNSRKYFCVNYFLSEETLEVPDKNIFTATEVSFLLPTYNHSLYRKFMSANSWSKNFLPNFPLRQQEWLSGERKSFVKSWLEKFLSGRSGEKLDAYFFRLTLKFWKKKFSHFDESTFDFRLRSRKNVSKHHPMGYQEKVLSKYSENVKAFMATHHFPLHAEDTLYA